MIKLIEDYISSTPKMDFYTLVPSDKRRIPNHFTRQGVGFNYYSYVHKCNFMEINPTAPLASWQFSEYTKVSTPKWAEPKYLVRFYTLAAFYNGGLDEEYVWAALPGLHQGCRDDEYVQNLVKRILRINNKMYANMITNTIKPITM